VEQGQGTGQAVGTGKCASYLKPYRLLRLVQPYNRNVRGAWNRDREQGEQSERGDALPLLALPQLALVVLAMWR
jgi:hypothetical protein